jgi:hypothetical protein
LSVGSSVDDEALPRADAPAPPARAGISYQDSLDLMAYLVTAADLCTYEPLHYGMFRLIDAASRLAAALEAAQGPAAAPWVRTARARIDSGKELLMWDRAAFECFVQEVAGMVAEAIDGERQLTT